MGGDWDSVSLTERGLGPTRNQQVLERDTPCCFFQARSSTTTTHHPRITCEFIAPSSTRCPQLPPPLRSMVFSPVKYECVQDDCNAAETKERVALSSGLGGRCKEPPCFQGSRLDGGGEQAGGQQILNDPENNSSPFSQRGYKPKGNTNWKGRAKKK
ncbi:unnamed protein product [Pleuronectes platessa]|uniref:Uncharacterized protein n=1 Tax=Pleuronectes platessa TaxID=8262 RepID=A0A9N7YJE5_PLEPL|nr:unnamed protein product [Pleuronectes platessa]